MSEASNNIPSLLVFDRSSLPRFEARLFFEGPQRKRSTLNFFIFLSLATVIATYGIITSSTATVVGAMIVAPLMTPIMASAAAIVMGDYRRLFNALGLVSLGIISVILLSGVLSILVPASIVSFDMNQEIQSRISPGLLALFIALASGAAGGFAVSREDALDALPGVAIAISLVPPLSVVGICLAQGHYYAARGALLMFMTNFLAIMLAGGAVFFLIRLGRITSSEEQLRHRRRVFAVVIIGVLLVCIPLTAAVEGAVITTRHQLIAEASINQWLGNTPAEIVSVNVTPSLVSAVITSPEQVQPDQALLDTLKQQLGYPVGVDMRVIPEQHYNLPAP